MADPKGPDPEFLAAMNRALDVVLDEFERSGIGVMPSHAEVSKFIFSMMSRRRRDWKHSKECLYPGCGAKTVISHAVPRTGPLRLIAEEGHLVTPAFSTDDGGLGVQLVGLGRASTFPGFCLEHEAHFGRFEKNR